MVMPGQSYDTLMAFLWPSHGYLMAALHWPNVMATAPEVATVPEVATIPEVSMS